MKESPDRPLERHGLVRWGQRIIPMDRVTFDAGPPGGAINFGIGQPSADLLPIDLLRQANESFLGEAQPFELNYGFQPGDEPLVESLAGFLAEEYHASLRQESLLVTAGVS